MSPLRERSSLRWVNLACLALAACATNPAGPGGGGVESDSDVRPISGLILSGLAVRRPLGQAASPEAVPGEPDYQAKPGVDARFDCRTWEETLSAHLGDGVARLRACFKLLQADKSKPELLYRLERGEAPQAVFKLEPREDTPPCVREVLAEIPVPREIVYQTVERGGIECYATRLELDDVHIIVRFPLPKAPLEIEDVRQQLLVWALAPLFGESYPRLRGLYVPSSICQRCLGARVFRQGQMTPPLWPSDALPAVKLAPLPLAVPKSGS